MQSFRVFFKFRAKVLDFSSFFSRMGSRIFEISKFSSDEISMLSRFVNRTHPVYGILNGRVHTTVDNANAISESAHPFRLIKRLLLINRDENRPETDKTSRCGGR